MQNKYIKRIALTGLALFSVVSLVGCSNPEPETVFYNGIELNKDDLSMETLQWLEYYNGLDEMEQYALSYIPEELLVLSSQSGDDTTQSNPTQESVDETEPANYDLGVTLEATEVTSKGMTLVCHQSGGENVVELSTGSFYTLQRQDKKEWVDVDTLPQEGEIAWDALAWLIKLDDSTNWDVAWGWLYGELPAGTYRIGKEIMNFRVPGDFDTMMCYAEFTITDSE